MIRVLIAFWIIGAMVIGVLQCKGNADDQMEQDAREGVVVFE